MATAKKNAPKVEEKDLTSALKEGPRSNRELREKLGLKVDQYDPKLDRALQKLRKEGKIQIVGGRWSMHSVSTCPTCGGKGWVQKK